MIGDANDFHGTLLLKSRKIGGAIASKVPMTLNCSLFWNFRIKGIWIVNPDGETGKFYYLKCLIFILPGSTLSNEKNVLTLNSN